MATKRPKPKPADSPTTMLDVQFAMAQAQRAMAEALLALSSGRVPEFQVPIGLTDPASEYKEKGTLFLDGNDIKARMVGSLPKPLKDFGGKRIRLEFTLHKTDLLSTQSGTGTELLTALRDFLVKRSIGEVLMEATCADHNIPPTTVPPAAE